MAKNRILVDWEEFGIMVDKLALKIRRSGMKFDNICGIARGGLPLAVALSHKLKIPFTEVPEGDNLLVVDDISDTGKTLEKFKDSTIACLYSSDWTKTKPFFYVKTKTDEDSWIVFPWEKIC